MECRQEWCRRLGQRFVMDMIVCLPPLLLFSSLLFCPLALIAKAEGHLSQNLRKKERKKGSGLST